MITNGKKTTNHIIRSPLRPRSAPNHTQPHVFSPVTSTGSIKIRIILSVFFFSFPFLIVSVFSISINNVEFNFQ